MVAFHLLRRERAQSRLKELKEQAKKDGASLSVADQIMALNA